MKVNYLGLELSSPIVVGSCGLSSVLPSIKALDEAGAGAIVLKSLFEEQILGESAALDNGDCGEASDYINNYVKQNAVSSYVNLIKEAKRECRAAIIASICCTKKGDWTGISKEIELAGADALELNVLFMPSSPKESAASIEQCYLDVVASVTEAVTIPVSVKLPNKFTNPLYIINELYYRKVKGVVLFNRFYEPTINVVEEEVCSTEVLTTNGESRLLIRWIALAAGEIPTMDVAATTGIKTGDDVVKMLLAGAKTVEIASVLYTSGIETITKMNVYLEEYMKDKRYESLDDFTGKLSAKCDKSRVTYDKAQFMKYYSNYKK